LWGDVLAASSESHSPSAKAALERLCRTYWSPLYAYVRRRGYSPVDAQDLTQAFFARLLEKNYPAQADQTKGKFRSFLLITLNHFLSDEADRARALKRGGGLAFVPLDTEEAEALCAFELAADATPDKVFERRWAMALLERASARLAQEQQSNNKAETYAVLKEFLPGEQPVPGYANAAERLGLTESAVKSQIWRLRQRYRELVREEISQTVATVSEVDEELRHLLALLSN